MEATGKGMRLGRRERVWLGVAIAVAFLFSADLAYLRPLLAEASAQQMLLAQARGDVVGHRVELRQRAQVEAAWLRVRDRIRKETTREIGMQTMMADIDRWQEQAGVALLRHSMREPEVAAFLEWYVVEAEIEGAMPAILRFLYLVQTDPQLYRVRSLTLTPKAQAEGGVLRCSLAITKVLAGE